MSARVLAVLTLAASIGLVSPWMGREPAAVAAPMGAAVDEPMPQPAYDDSITGLHAAVEAAVRAHVPGIDGNNWTLNRLDHSDPDANGARRVVAYGVIATPGAPGTGVQLTGRYDPRTGEMTQVAYQLRPDAAASADGRKGVADKPVGTWSVQREVQRALAAALPGQTVRFALDSAQSTRLQDGGRRFEGFGIGTWDGGRARFVAFTLELSADGQPVAFDYGTETDDDDEATMIARY